MTIDWWALGLQAVNVLILVWLLSRLFWRPVAAAIAQRKDAAQAMLGAAKAAQVAADAALAEVSQDRVGIAAERETMLATAAAAADTAKAAALDAAHKSAEALIAAARLAIDRDAEASRKVRAAQAAQLAVDIAAKLLERLGTPAVHAVFLAQLVEAIAAMPPHERAALAGAATSTDLVSATDIGDVEKAKIAQAVGQALGGSPKLTFVTDAGLIAGFELRTPHFVLHNSWQSDLARILKGLKNAA